MRVILIEDVFSHFEPGQTLAGLDLGTKTIGVSVSDLSLSFANPRPVILRSKFFQDVKNLKNLIQTEKIAIFVIGLPLNMNGSHGPRVQSTRTFVSKVSKILETPFIFWDERLSTVAAERALLEQDMSRQKRIQKIDSAAATFILQGALDRLRFVKRSL